MIANADFIIKEKKNYTYCFYVSNYSVPVIFDTLVFEL